MCVNHQNRNQNHLSTTGSRGHSLKLFKRSFKRNVWKYTFSNRVIDSWNRLPEDIIACESLDNLKRKLDRLFYVLLGVNIFPDLLSFLPVSLTYWHHVKSC